ncbi:MAG: hypothetical protein L3J71_03275 [Victivallaceae bacterium]|nr:hypothetical protein [Victivallaceae bacterium]
MTIKNGVFVARDAIAKITGHVFKFKPWGATKLASSISRWVGPIGAGLQLVSDAIDMIKKQKAEKKLQQVKKDISDMTKYHFKVVWDILQNNSKVFEIFAPQISTFEDILKQQEQTLENLLSPKDELERVLKEFLSMALQNDVVDVDYTDITD